MKRVVSIALALVMIMGISSAAIAEGEKTAKFSDLEAGSRIEEAVIALSEKGILSGYPDGTYKPEGMITRAEFATVIAKMKNLPMTLELDVVTGFEDLDADVQHEWARPYVKSAVAAGIINGFEDKSFRASQSVTYEQAVKMIVCALDMQKDAETQLEELKKANAETTWSAGYIAVANENDITKDATCEDITVPATRGIVAILVSNAQKVLETENKEEEPETEAPKELKKIRILSFGNSYTDDSFRYLGPVGRAAGYDFYAVNMYKGSCALSHHYKFMKGEGTYESRKIYLSDMTIDTTKGVSFDEGLATDGGNWDFITIHQKGESSPFFEKYEPYLPELSQYIKKKCPDSELLVFENWSAYTDRIASRDAYKDLIAGVAKAKYIPTVFASIKNSYIKAARAIGNPGRVIPAGEAVYRAITKYGFEEKVETAESTAEKPAFDKTARAMYRDTSSHLSFFHGRILVALTWYEYLTGEDARENPYKNDNISEEDMKLLKEIAHEVCTLPEYNK